MTRQATSLRAFWRQCVQHPLWTLWVVSFLFSLALWNIFVQEVGIPASREFIVGTLQNSYRLSDADAALYKMAYDAQDRADFDTADLSMSQLTDRRLVGDLLADRYLSGQYSVSNSELSQWLSNYADHSQAYRLSKLAVQRGMDVAVIPAEPPLRGEGYAEHLGRTTMPDGWYRGLSLWREQQFSEAQPLFTAIGNDESLSDWQRSAGYYWAARAATRLNDHEAVQQNLTAAAHYKTTFYGLLAAAQTGTLDLKITAPTVSTSLRDNPKAIRAALFTQIGRGDDAEEELRHLYTNASTDDRAGLVTLAHELNLSNLQVRLAGMQQLSDAEALFARYPTPQFMVDAQKEVSPALLLAITRNESGFRESSANHVGALGLMQMLPATAHAIERRVGRSVLESDSADTGSTPLVDRLNDPAISARYGAEYIKILAREPVVNNNLIRLLAAYNAGSGTVAGWQSMATKIEDPLLYVESIPYPETHNYVMQVMAQYWVYQIMLGEKTVSLDAMAHGQWPQLALAQ